MMNTLVTGAAGFVGLALTEALLAVGQCVIALDAAPLPAAAQTLFATLPGTLQPIVADVRDADIHDVLYTSGTTGTPKGAMISQCAAATRALRLAEWFRLTPDDGFIGWLPMFHCRGDESLYASWLSGGRYSAFTKVDVVEMFRRIEKYRLSWTLLLPGVITSFLNHPDRGAFDLSLFRFAIGYANMMPQVIADLTRTLNLSFFDAFGQTESSYLLAHAEALPDAVAPEIPFGAHGRAHRRRSHERAAGRCPR